MRISKTLIGAIVFVVLMGTARGQGGVPANGTEILRGLIKYHGFKPVKSLDPNSRSTLVVVIGRISYPPQILGRFPRHIADGGGFLAISDSTAELTSLMPSEGNLTRAARITGQKVENPIADNCFRGEAESPLPAIAPGDPTMIALAKRGAAPVLATRGPSTITTLDNSFLGVDIAKFPDGTRYLNRNRMPVMAHIPFAVMSDPALAGTAMAYANRAMFSNEFMVATDANGNRADNFLYTFLLVRYIAQRLKANGGPMECVFIENGIVTTDFDRVGFVERPEMNLPPGFPPVLPPLPVLMDFVLDKGNELVDKAEQRDIPNVIQKNDRNNQIQNGMLTTLAVVLSIVLARYLLARGWGTRHAPELAPRHRIDPDRGGVIPERRYALLESGNLYEPMRDHLRVVFAGWGAPGDPRKGLPEIAADRPTRPLRRIAGDLDRLWQIAFRPERTTVTPDDLEELEDMISELSNAHASGIWRFAAGGAA